MSGTHSSDLVRIRKPGGTPGGLARDITTLELYHPILLGPALYNLRITCLMIRSLSLSMRKIANCQLVASLVFGKRDQYSGSEPGLKYPEYLTLGLRKGDQKVIGLSWVDLTTPKMLCVIAARKRELRIFTSVNTKKFSEGQGSLCENGS